MTAELAPALASARGMVNFHALQGGEPLSLFAITDRGRMRSRLSLASTHCVAATTRATASRIATAHSLSVIALLCACRGMAARCARAGSFKAFQMLHLLGCKPCLCFGFSAGNAFGSRFVRSKSATFKPVEDLYLPTVVTNGAPCLVI